MVSAAAPGGVFLKPSCLSKNFPATYFVHHEMLNSSQNSSEISSEFYIKDRIISTVLKFEFLKEASVNASKFSRHKFTYKLH